MENISHSQNSSHTMEMATFYLVMALGAINHDNTIKELKIQAHESSFQHRIASGHSSALLYLKALKQIDLGAQCCTPSISLIRILLLISIYSSYEPISSSQWQLIGLAMRMAIELGLHTPSRASRLPDSEKEQRKSIFWTIYAMEINLAYNLGRPPSLGEEHITTDLPIASSATCFSTHHIKHRQIQGRIISQVYAANKSARNTTETDVVIARLQEELDEWRLSIPNPTKLENATSYPYDFWIRLYHGTSFVLHRSSPLRPDPPPESLERCLRSASAYIDNIYALLRSSNIPISWMLVQGILFAGLTMLTTARMGFRQLASHMGSHCLIVDLPAWIRRCSVCLAIINERWNEDLLSRLDSQFEVIANDTLRIISSSLLSPRVSDTLDVTPFYYQSIANPPSTPANCSPPNILAEDNLADGGDPFDLMLDMMGLDPMETFWDFSSLG
ncbi:hypothetical protein BS50DRAFT_507798 [Corynespora cassiicola Philippines]|uniref:Xylanolytic transcriptional activator regulatory domain-containing protein n=1 Tax=Corynespora cassiicola Philippines TaxID=1448308 RepID=A0A2T2N2U5_CORCC|nr:hypothetical protein BS50DRAFT_507798 [Corynespora cassiicola Philippines]